MNSKCGRRIPSIPSALISSLAGQSPSVSTPCAFFLHDLPWQQDAEDFASVSTPFSRSPQNTTIKPLLVLFDSCWDANPQLGKQRDPRPGVHNSGWGRARDKALQHQAQYPLLERYVKGVLGAFAKDDRIIGWDVWNEPDNSNGGRDGDLEPETKTEIVLKLLPRACSNGRGPCIPRNR